MIRIKGLEKSKNILKKKLLTQGPLLEKKGLDFYKSYYLQQSRNLPLIDAKIAISKDYFTKHIKKMDHQFIFPKRSHLLRSMYDCLYQPLNL